MADDKSSQPPGGGPDAGPPPPPPPSPPAWGTPPPPAPSWGAPPPPAGYGASPGYGYGVPAQTEGLATGALVCGIIGLAVCQPVGIVAIVLGNRARNRIRASGGMLGGEGMAKAGVILGWISVALMVLFIGLIIALAASGNGGGNGSGS